MTDLDPTTTPPTNTIPALLRTENNRALLLSRAAAALYLPGDPRRVQPCPAVLYEMRLALSAWSESIAPAEWRAHPATTDEAQTTDGAS